MEHLPGHPGSNDPRESPGRLGPATDASPPVAAHGSRARQREETRERIFETALREFREVGLSAARIERIAKKAGVARGTFYFHFPTKEDVMLELARRINARIVRRMARIVAEEPGLRAFLLRLNDVLIDEHARIGEAGLHAELISLYIRRPYDLSDPLHNVPTLNDELGRFLNGIIQRGELKLRLPVDQLSVVILSSLFGVLARMRLGEEMRTTCNSLVELLVLGLEAEA